MKKNILCFDAFPAGGGGQKRLAKHMQQLQADGHQIAVTCPPGNPFLSGLAPAGVRSISVPMSACITDWSARPRVLAGIIAYAALTVRLLPIPACEKPDLIYALGSRSAKAVLLSARLTGTPLVWTSGNIHPISWLDRRLLDASCGVICLCNTIRDQYAGLREAAGKLHVIYGSVDVAALAAADGAAFRAELGLAPDDVLLGVVGRISPLKGQAEFLEAALGLMARRPEVHAVIVGVAASHDEAYHRGLQALARNSPAGDRVHFIGWRNDTPKILKGLDVLVLPSYEEGFGNILLEAMAASKPTAAFAVGGVLEIVVGGVTGLLVPPRDVEALQQAIAGLVADAPFREALGCAGQARAREFFDDRIVLPQVSRLFDRLLAGDPLQQNRRTESA